MKRKIAGWRNEICRSEILFKKNQGYNGNNLNVPKSLKAAAQKLCREYNQTMPDEGEKRSEILHKLQGECSDLTFVEPALDELY